jgi:YggT family protein
MLALAITRADIANYVDKLFTVYILLIFVYILVNLMFSLGVRPPYSRWTDALLNLLLPPIGMFDLSPMIAIILLYFVRSLVVNAIAGT